VPKVVILDKENDDLRESRGAKCNNMLEGYLVGEGDLFSKNSFQLHGLILIFLASILTGISCSQRKWSFNFSFVQEVIKILEKKYDQYEGRMFGKKFL